ncbi:MAG: 1,4-alpha-glucan branching protein GlgB, partial [Myxococcota bacterium]
MNDSGSAEEWDALRRGDHSTPHGLLGVHPRDEGLVVRAFHPEAIAAGLVKPDGSVASMRALGDGAFVLPLPAERFPFRFRVRWEFADGGTFEEHSPYQFEPTVGEVDLHLFNEGRHRQLWSALGARVMELDGVTGVAFAVWAPAAKRVSVVGDFCRWNGLVYPMRAMGSSGVFELFVPGLDAGELYKFEIRTQAGHVLLKTDPMARAMEHPPKTASRVYASQYSWNDHAWMEARDKRNVREEPLAVYEVHLGSWLRDPAQPERILSYREIGRKLISHAKDYGFNAIELMPITEFPFDGSWGYQVSGYYAPTARFGAPDDLKWFVDQCHQAGLSILIDWVPAHFPKDGFALAQFDGSHLYEHPDPRRGEHPDWGTLIFNYGRNEVRCFLIASALYWLKEFHVDGIRVDAVASMLYLDYSREDGTWEPNAYGGREHLEAVDFIREFNEAVRLDAPGCYTIAEESTSWPGVTQGAHSGGLGFSLKWNMGWMHDTLLYMQKEPVHRRYHHDQLTFAMIYEHSERFLMPLSHDEVVHGKGSLLSRIPGDRRQQLATLRAYYGYMWAHPGKQLLFMGGEYAQPSEWSEGEGLDWPVSWDEAHRGV